MPTRAPLLVVALWSLLGCAGADAPPAPPPATPPPVATLPAAATPAGPAYPATERRAVSSEYFGTKVTEDYRWLEDWADPAVQRWSEAENAFARAHLDGIAARAKLKDRLHALLAEPSSSYADLRHRKGALFGLKREPPRQQRMLVVMTAAADPAAERVVVDPNAIDPTGGTAIDWYVPSLDGKRVAVSLSKGGSEDGSLHVYDVASGKEQGEAIPHVQYATGGGSAAWDADGKGLYYTRYPRDGERPPEDLHFYQQVYFHRLGTSIDRDTYVIGKDFPRIAEIALRTSDDGKSVLVEVANGDGGEFAYWWAPRGKPFVKVVDFADGVTSARLGPDGALYLLSQKDAPRRRVLRLDLRRKGAAPTEVVPASEAVVSAFAVTPHRLYTLDVVGGPSQVRVFTLDRAGGPAKGGEQIPLDPVSSVWQIVRLGGDEILYETESFVRPPAWHRYAPGKPPIATALARRTKVDFSDAEVVEQPCTSKDGTKVPMFVLRKRGTKLDGSAPALLTGYGGYSVNEQPWFRVETRLWLDLGGVFATAVLRGGGEWGEGWHRDGNLLKKQNVFDDMYACAQGLVKSGTTRPEKLAIMGGSNGGLLMGAELTQHPEAFRAVVSRVGIYDMLRSELTPNGSFNVTEYGTVKDEAQLRALHAYSPYHHVTDGVKYPAVLMTTGQNDARVDPWHSRKMTARLQAATSSGLPVLLRTSGSTGHGMGTPLHARIEEAADIHAFLVEQLGIAVP